MDEYIKREALIEQFKFKRKNDARYAGLESAIEEVLNAPTADVVEVRHGKWEILGLAVIDTIASVHIVEGKRYGEHAKIRILSAQIVVQRWRGRKWTQTPSYLQALTRL